MMSTDNAVLGAVAELLCDAVECGAMTMEQAESVMAQWAERNKARVTGKELEGPLTRSPTHAKV